MPDDNVIRAENLSVQYKTRAGWVSAVDDVSLEIRRGEILGLVGESGCGKSTLGKALMRLIRHPARITNGHIWFQGIDLMTLSDNEMRQFRGRNIGMIFQDPMTSLNPIQRVVEHLIETIRTHEPAVSDEDAHARAADLVDRLGISANRLDDYPHQLSGGMRQRVMISLALALNADLIIADEATTSLDVIVEAQFVELLQQLCRDLDLAILMITHNIGLVAEVADRVAVMYAGRMAEMGSACDVFKEPLHPYTQGLLKAVPNIHLEEDELYKMEGSPPDLVSPPPACRFHPRCPHMMPVCSKVQPDFETARGDHRTACWLYQDVPAEYQDVREGSKA
ncbi:MAG: ABC transporter ATP-binding protein [Anaerolineae bacterium]|nr:ABC transporter ATP-binding protein [Anaerolineae bacterium]